MTHPIHMLWAHPRSVSTAFERVMRERGDLTVFHEPFMHFYYLTRTSRLSAEFEAIPGHPTTYQDTRDLILKTARKGPVFVKDMAYYMADLVLADDEFLAPMTHVVLVRDPSKTAASYARIDPNFDAVELGFNAQWALVQGLQAREIPVHVMASARLRANPGREMERYWDFAGLSQMPGALSWQKGTPADWEYVAGWHESVTGSTGIEPPGKTEAPILKPRLQDVVASHRSAYDALMALTQA